MVCLGHGESLDWNACVHRGLPGGQRTDCIGHVMGRSIVYHCAGAFSGDGVCRGAGTLRNEIRPYLSHAVQDGVWF